MSHAITVLCVDDHPLMREGIVQALASVPDMRLIAEACDGLRALDVYREFLPDVTVMDLQMPRRDGVDAMISIRAEFPDARFVVLSDVVGEPIERRARAAGAAAFLGKDVAAGQLVAAIRETYRNGGPAASPRDRISRAGAGEDGLTSREVEILRWVAQGQSNHQIARQVGLAESTVNNYLKRILLKLDAADRTHAVTRAMLQGLLDARQ